MMYLTESRICKHSIPVLSLILIYLATHLFGISFSLSLPLCLPFSPSLYPLFKTGKLRHYPKKEARRKTLLKKENSVYSYTNIIQICVNWITKVLPENIFITKLRKLGSLCTWWHSNACILDYSRTKCWQCLVLRTEKTEYWSYINLGQVLKCQGPFCW